MKKASKVLSRNPQRARIQRAQIILAVYERLGGDPDMLLQDMLSDLMHWAEANGKRHGYYKFFDECMATARMNYEGERGAGDDIEQNTRYLAKKR